MAFIILEGKQWVLIRSDTVQSPISCRLPHWTLRKSKPIACTLGACCYIALKGVLRVSNPKTSWSSILYLCKLGHIFRRGQLLSRQRCSSMQYNIASNNIIFFCSILQKQTMTNMIITNIVLYSSLMSAMNGYRSIEGFVYT